MTFFPQMSNYREGGGEEGPSKRWRVELEMASIIVINLDDSPPVGPWEGITAASSMETERGKLAPVAAAQNFDCRNSLTKVPTVTDDQYTIEAENKTSSAAVMISYVPSITAWGRVLPSTTARGKA